MRGSRTALRTALISVALQAWIVVFAGFLGGYIVSVDPWVRLVAQLVAVAPLVAWAAFRLRGPRDVLDIAVASAVLAHVVVSVFSLDRTGSLEASAMAVAMATLFWLMRDVAGHDRLRRMAAAAVLAVQLPWLAAIAVAWVIEKVDWVAAGGGLPDLESFQVFIWGTANVIPILLLMAVAFVAWLPNRQARLVGWLVLGGLSGILVPFSAGRAGWLGILVALLMLEPLSGWPVRRWVTRRSGFGRAAWRLILGGGLLLTAVGLLRFGPTIVANLDSRFRIWSQAIGILLADPLTGSGPSTYSWVRLQHVPDYVDRVPVILSHSVLFQTLADGGLILFIAFAAVLITSVSVVWSRREKLLPAQRVGVAVLAGLAAASLLDDFSFLPAVMALGITIAAWSVPPPDDEQRPALPDRARLWLPAGIAVLAVALLPSVIQVNRARISADVGRNAAVSGDWRAAERAFRTASEAYPEHPGYQLSLGLVAAEQGNVAGALSAYERARRLSPGDPRGAGGMAALVSDANARIALLDEAARHSNDPIYAFRLAEALAAAGREADAALAMAHAVVLEPTLIGLLESLAVVDTQAVVDQLPRATDATGSVLAVDPSVPLWDAGLWGGDLPIDADSPWHAVAAALAGDWASADAFLIQAREAAGRDPRPYLAAEAVARLKCDEADYLAARRLEVLILGEEEPNRTNPMVSLRDRVYREPGLGDYQPAAVIRPPKPSRWPQSLVELPPCEWGP